MDLRLGVDSIHVAQDSDHWRISLSMVMTFSFHEW
jgi:hypothetical protein